MSDSAEKDFFSNTFNKSPHTDTRMTLSNWRRKRSLLKLAGTQEFILFEPFLILPKDARSGTVRRPRSGDTRSSPGSQ
jgi:hypothetical protein